MSEKILVLNSTGNVGRGVVLGLAQAGEQVKAASRHPERATVPAGVEKVRFDFGDASSYGPALEGVDRVFLLGPTGDLAAHESLIPFLKVALEGGKRKVVLMTASGVEYDESAPLRKVERFVEASGAPYVFLRPNWFMDNFINYWLMPIKQGTLYLPAADARSAFVDARDISDSAVAALRTNRFDGQAFTVTGGEALSYGQAMEILSKATGRTILYVAIDDETFRAALISNGLDVGYAGFMVTLYGFVRQGAAAHPTDSVLVLTGKAPRTLEAFAEEHAAVWQP